MQVRWGLVGLGRLAAEQEFPRGNLYQREVDRSGLRADY